MLPTQSHGAQNLSIPNHYFAFSRQVMEKIFLFLVKMTNLICRFELLISFAVLGMSYHF
jgi:hypothetical protein